jgi:acetyl-CoA carboxylase carboxyl transferase subunit alpha
MVDSRKHAPLDFEVPIFEMEAKIEELEELSRTTKMNLNGEVRPLKDKLGQLIAEIFENLTPWQRVQLARHPARPFTSDYIDLMFDDFLELHGDRLFKDDRAIACGLATLQGRRVLVIGHRKGRDTKEKLACNFGCAHPEGYRKALLKMQLAEKFGLPIITFINTPGAYPGIGAEERGQAFAIAENLVAMAGLRVPVISVVIGEGGSGGALGIGVGDRVFMLEHSYYSVISPEGCAAILWKSAEKASEAAEALKITSTDLLRLGVVDEVIPEPLGGAHRRPQEMIDALQARLISTLDELSAQPIDDLVQGRYDKFRAIGSVFGEGPAQMRDVEEPPQDKDASAE